MPDQISDYDLLTEHEVIGLTFGGHYYQSPPPDGGRLPRPMVTLADKDGEPISLWRRAHVETWLDEAVTLEDIQHLTHFPISQFAVLADHRLGPPPLPDSAHRDYIHGKWGPPWPRLWRRRDVLAWTRDGCDTRTPWPTDPSTPGSTPA